MLSSSLDMMTNFSFSLSASSTWRVLIWTQMMAAFLCSAYVAAISVFAILLFFVSVLGEWLVARRLFVLGEERTAEWSETDLFSIW